MRLDDFTRAVNPQTHTVVQYEPDCSITVRPPNVRPTSGTRISPNFLARICPHDFVCPVVTELVRVENSCPQSHRHRASLPTFSMMRTLLNRCPE